jgi:ABC-type Fe3+-hydroxamate transport system substrate-binding protein
LKSLVKAILLIAFVACATAGVQAATPILLKDDWGREFSLPDRPRRLITLAAHLTEIAIDVGMSQQIVATDVHSPLVSKVSEKVIRLSAYPEPSIENIVKLKPDLVLLWGAGLKAASVARLESLGIRVFVSEPKSLLDIVSTFETLSRFSYRPPIDILQRVNAYKNLLQPRRVSKEIPVFVQVWSEPLMTIGQGGFIANALKHCGAKVWLAPLHQSSAVINPEAVVQSDVKVIVSSNMVATKDYWRKRAAEKSLSWSYISLPESTLSQPSTKLLDSITVLCERLDSLR